MRLHAANIATAAAIAAVAVLVALPGNTMRDTSPRPAPVAPCAVEDSPGPCVWDASSRGNGQGTSFYRDASGVTHPIH